jgi:Ca-activated chloride channel family protein
MRAHRAWACALAAVFGLLGLIGGVSVAWAQTMAIAALRTAPEGGAFAEGEESNVELVDEDVAVVIDEQHATTVLRHNYHNTSGSRLEGQFILRAGEGAVVNGFAYWNGEQKIVGEVFEKEIATAIYDDTVQRKRDPGLLTQIGEGAFAFRVFPIEAGEHKRIELRFDQWLSRHGKVVEYRVPVTRADAKVRIEIKDDRVIGNISSSSHQLDVDRQGDRILCTSEGAHGTRHELVLRYEIKDTDWSLAAAVHRDADHDGYVVLSLPAPKQAGSALAKDVTLVIDRSGSMLGEPMERAKAAAITVVERLAAADRLNVVVFDDGVDALWQAPRAASEKNRAAAVKFIENTDEGGGTDIALALSRALEHQADDERPKTILFFTDGQSEGPPALEVAQRDERDVRVFTIGLGDVDKPLLARLAAIKRGRFTYVESAGTLEQKVTQLYGQIAEPALVGVKLSVTGEDGALYHSYPRSLPDVFNGDELVVVSRIQGSGALKLTVSGESKSGPVSAEATIDLGTARRTWVGRMWARRRVEHLLEEIALKGETGELKSEAIELGLAYNLVTPYTAFLAIPESELTAGGKDLLAAARAQRQEALAYNPDAGALAQPSPPPDHGSEAKMMADGPGAPSPIHGRAGGCAGCSTATGPAFGDLFPFALLGLALAIRRRRP